MTVFVIVAFLGLIFGSIGAAIGKNKGLAVAGFLLGVLCGPIGLVVVAVIQPSQERSDRVAREHGMTQCPHCREYVRPDATVCSHCQRDVAVVNVPVDEAALDREWQLFNQK